MRDLDELFQALARSKFRARQRLGSDDLGRLRSRGLPATLAQGRALLQERLAPAEPARDGKQTPMRGHPVFVAQHATGSCCRGCLAKWHRIPAGRPLTEEELDQVLAVIERWLRQQDALSPIPSPSQLDLLE